MGFFDFLKAKSDGRFITAAKLKKNLDRQTKMLPQTLGQLRALEVTASKELRLEYFFYTNTLDKAAALATELQKSGYSADYGVSAGNKNLFLITGWTTAIAMSDGVVKKWVEAMIETGYRFDCDFDGWGTTLDQQ